MELRHSTIGFLLSFIPVWNKDERGVTQDYLCKKTFLSSDLVGKLLKKLRSSQKIEEVSRGENFDLTYRQTNKGW